MSSEQIKKVTPAAVFHSIGHVCTVVSLGAGSVSFTHIVKAAEPIFSTVLSAIILKSYSPTVVNLTLLPVVAGVAVASMKVCAM
jgi:solute carrier family 35 protein E1